MPRVLLLSYSYAGQSRRVADVMAETFRQRGFEVEQAAIEFTDARYAKRFSRFPLRHAYLGRLRPRLHRVADVETARSFAGALADRQEVALAAVAG